MKKIVLLFVFGIVVSIRAEVEPLIIDHNDIDITQLTQAEIERAKSVLHIGYGHTSHGSQITDGMTGLVDFANGGGKGLSLPTDIFEWNNGGTDGALDLEEGSGYSGGWLQLDGGYWPTWYNETIEYLDDPSHSDVNVIMWSWCGQMDNKYASNTLTNEYIAPMAELEATYSNVVFVYMTGHVPGNSEMNSTVDSNTKAACDVLRNWCIDNNKVFFDFNDIEHYNPDRTYFEFVTDGCNYHSYAGGSAVGNWATEWQNTHTSGVDWYSCSSAHSQPVNANMKAYAIWKLWCELAKDIDRDGFNDEWEEKFGGKSIFCSTNSNMDSDNLTDWQEYIADTDPTNSNDFFCVTAVSNSSPITVCFKSSSNRYYSLLGKSNLTNDVWQFIVTRAGSGTTDSMTNSNSEARYFKLKVEN